MRKPAVAPAAPSARLSALLGRLCLLLCLLPPPAAVVADSYHIEISKSERSMKLKQKQKVIKEYFIAHGKGGLGTKRRRGDGKTPLGSYRVAEFKEQSKFHFFILLDYPNPLDAWHGYQRELISGADFKNIAAAHKHARVPPQSTRLGGYIGIHGIGEATGEEMREEKLRVHREHNWTDGCIAVRDHEITELKELVTVGTPVLITD